MLNIELKFTSGEAVVLQTPFAIFPKKNLRHLIQEGSEVTLHFGEEIWTLPCPKKLPSMDLLKSAKIIR